MNIIKFIIPSFIYNKINERKNLKKIILNINWLTFEKVFNMLMGLVVGAWVARYLGPENFGKYNYAISFVALFTFISTLGLEQIVVRNLVKNPDKKNEILGASFFLRLIGSIILNIIVLLLIYILKLKSPQIRIFIIIVSIGYVFRSVETIRYWFRSQLQSKYATIASTISLIISNGIKIILIINSASVICFVFVVTLNYLFIAVLFFMFYQSKSDDSVFRWKINFDTIKSLLKDSWPLILSGAAIEVHMRIDQVMIGNMVNEQALGIYAAAIKLKKWSFIAVVISNSVFPSLLETRKNNKELYYKRLQTLYDIMFWISLSIAITISFSSGFIINFIYGVDYSRAAIVLSIQSWNAIFNFFGIITASYLIAENLTKINFYKTFIGATFNILLNLLLIPKYGIIGASVSSLLAVSIQSLFITLLFKDTKKLFYMFLKSINIYRIIKKSKKI